VRKTSVGEDWHYFGQSVQKSSSESNDCFIPSCRLSKRQSLLTTILLRTPQDLENKIPPRYGMSLMGSNLLQWLLYGKQLPRPNGALWLAIAWSGFYSRGCYHKSAQFHFNIFFYCSHTTGKFKLQNKKADKVKLIWAIILTSEPNITKISMLQRDKWSGKCKLKQKGTNRKLYWYVCCECHVNLTNLSLLSFRATPLSPAPFFFAWSCCFLRFFARANSRWFPPNVSHDKSSIIRLK